MYQYIIVYCTSLSYTEKSTETNGDVKSLDRCRDGSGGKFPHTASRPQGGNWENTNIKNKHILYLQSLHRSKNKNFLFFNFYSSVGWLHAQDNLREEKIMLMRVLIFNFWIFSIQVLYLEYSNFQCTLHIVHTF